MLRPQLRYTRLCWLELDSLCKRPPKWEREACYIWPLHVLMWLSTAFSKAQFTSSLSPLEVLCQTGILDSQQCFTRNTFLQPRPGIQASNVRRDCEYAWECVQQECQKLLVDLLHASATAASNGRSDASAGAPILQCLTCCPSTGIMQHETQFLCPKIWS